MKKILITIVAVGFVLFAYQANAAEIIPYGSFNYKLSNDENSSGKSYSKLEDNGSSIGVEVIDLGVEGDTITGFSCLADLDRYTESQNRGASSPSSPLRGPSCEAPLSP